MSVITTINANDRVTDSRAVLNTNLANLNADKVETLANLGLTQTAVAYNNAAVNSPTAGEKAALAGGGALGTPSVSNKYVTETFLSASGTPTTQIFTASGTWTKPAGLKYAVVEVQAGGGGGGATETSVGQGGNGGAGGGYVKKLYASSALGATVVITIGAGGAGGATGTNPGAAGNTTTFGSLLTGALGGGGGLASNSGLVASTGGGATGGDVNIIGEGGNPHASSLYSGRGGSSVFSKGGRSVGVNAGGIAGINADGYGGGGSGALRISGSSVTGGNGSAGVIIVTEYYS